MEESGNKSLSNPKAGQVNDTGSGGTVWTSPIGVSIMAILVFLICIFGLVGNGLVFWYLCFRIKRNKYTVYVLNLAVADVIFLLCTSVLMLLMTYVLLAPNPVFANKEKILLSLEILLDFGNNADMYLLTAISVERCLSVLYPIWHRCKRSKYQSAAVCVFLWGFSCLVSLLDNLVCPSTSFAAGTKDCTAIQISTSVLTFLVVIPVMVLASLILLVVMRRTSKERHPPKIYIVIVASVIVLLISAAPMRLLWLLLYLNVFSSSFSKLAFFFASYVCTSCNCSANPFIYFLVGRQKRQGVRSYVKKALQRVFREEDEAENKDGEESSGKCNGEMGKITGERETFRVSCQRTGACI